MKKKLDTAGKAATKKLGNEQNKSLMCLRGNKAQEQVVINFEITFFLGKLFRKMMMVCWNQMLQSWLQGQNESELNIEPLELFNLG